MLCSILFLLIKVMNDIFPDDDIAFTLENLRSLARHDPPVYKNELAVDDVRFHLEVDDYAVKRLQRHEAIAVVYDNYWDSQNYRELNITPSDKISGYVGGLILYLSTLAPIAAICRKAHYHEGRHIRGALMPTPVIMPDDAINDFENIVFREVRMFYEFLSEDFLSQPLPDDVVPSCYKVRDSIELQYFDAIFNYDVDY